MTLTAPPIEPLLAAARPELLRKIINSTKLDIRMENFGTGKTFMHYLAQNVHEGITEVVDEWIQKKPMVIYCGPEGGPEEKEFYRNPISHPPYDWNERDMDGKTPLHDAMGAGSINFVKYLINNGADVNAKTVNGITPFAEGLVQGIIEDAPLFKRQKKRTECLEFLVEFGANIEIDQKIQRSVFIAGWSEAVKFAALSGVDLQAKDLHGRTVIHCLAKNTNEGIVDIIDEWIHLESNNDKMIDWNARDKNGRTPLHDAMANGNESFVEYLIKKSADINVKSAKGITPFFEALESKAELTLEQRYNCNKLMLNGAESTLEQRIKCVQLIMQNGACPNVDIERYFQKYNTKQAINRDFEFLKSLLAHLIIRQAKGEHFSEKLLESIDGHSKLKNYVMTCKEELEQMKSEQIYETINLFDFFIEPDKKFVFYKDANVYSELTRVINKHMSSDSYYSDILKKRYEVVSKMSSADKAKTWLLNMGKLILICIIFELAILYGVTSEHGFNEETLTEIIPKLIMLLGCFVVSILFLFGPFACFYYYKSYYGEHSSLFK